MFSPASLCSRLVRSPRVMRELCSRRFFKMQTESVARDRVTQGIRAVRASIDFCLVISNRFKRDNGTCDDINGKRVTAISQFLSFVLSLLPAL